MLAVGGDISRGAVLSAVISTPVVMRSTIEGSAKPMPASNPRTNHRHVPNRLATRLIEPHRSELAMTTSSRDVEPAIGQESEGSAPVAAAALMLTSAVLTFVVGVFALSANDFVVSEPGYEYTFRISGWGWVNLLMAILVAAVAVALFLNAPGTRAAATGVTCLAILVSFLWMPFYPTGSIVLIALDVVVIWGVATWHTPRGSA